MPDRTRRVRPGRPGTRSHGERPGTASSVGRASPGIRPDPDPDPNTGDGVRPNGARPNYVRRRLVAGVLLLGVIALMGALVAEIVRTPDSTADRGLDDGSVDVAPTSDEPDEQDPSEATDAATSSPVEGPTTVDDTAPDVSTTTAAARVTTPVDLPDHHGFQDDTLYVALYGTPGSDSLGVLGEQDVDAAVERAREVSSDYTGFGPTVVPTFEIIASVASFDPGSDGNYSNESSIERLRPWVDAADESGLHVVLDLQAGRARFDLQIQDFEELLLQPHVGVALDPEWRVGPDGVPEGGQIGTVTGAEVNATIRYLDALVAENGLPRKMLVVHQFADSMITEKSTIAGTDNVQVVLHMDGFGDLRLKRDTYARVTSDLPNGVLPGWKNFYDEDRPTPTPTETMTNEPRPVFVSFQ